MKAKVFAQFECDADTAYSLLGTSGEACHATTTGHIEMCIGSIDEPKPTRVGLDGVMEGPDLVSRPVMMPLGVGVTGDGWRVRVIDAVTTLVLCPRHAGLCNPLIDALDADEKG